ncbi:DExH-box ATP-dependent RNA helicase DExH17 [Cynara cardunculus var. scolymus]|uniref:DExH-box ATP-dependent RNA helicase DExH17 n=1 Tax=Cynara cardunculus var. scolymus TaxID=59895 RepID=UPI000D62C984|nr:DExH-box ATP-dependent RNA helicase DExH17 [Cynara cardunculus var. scolymus]
MDSYSLKSVSDLPDPFRSTFSFRYFNSLQSECFSACFHSDMNMVISAPTGSGKTVLFELCILRLLSKFISQEGRFIHMKGTLKTIYISPSKALVQEKLRSWNQKLGSWGINCLELTGDNESYSVRNIQEADIVLTTPEKFDAVTRFGIKDGGLSFFSDISLVLIDEVHLLNDPRGAALEAIVSRIKMISCSPQMGKSPLAHVRFLAVSATIPNIDDLAEWLMVPIQGIKRFGEEMRPVKLTTKVFGYAPAKNDFLFEKRLQNYIFDLLMQYSSGKSALVFCSTRKGAQEAAQRLSQTVMTHGYSNPFIKSRDQQERLKEASLSCGDKQMQSYILYGVGYHNGGLSPKDRNLIEGLFLNGDLQVLCTTNTLAHGINLPAHMVIIKSTQHFNKEKGIYMEYDRSMILQMCGRAGRPPFDDTGMVIIMTRRETVHLYENLLGGCELVESQLLSCVTEHLAAEVVQLTVPDITRAIEWMKCSYLYVRMKKNPQNYAVKKGLSNTHVEKHIQEVCVQKVNELAHYQMIWTDEDGFLLKPLEPGRLMTKYYLKFDTMKHIMKAPSSCSIEDALHIVCRAEEISWIQLRRNEKKLLNDINTDKDGRLRFHILGDKGKKKRRIQTREEKLFILANDCLTGDPLAHDLSLTQDMNSVCSNGCRIAKCMKEYFIYKMNYKGALNSILLAKSLHQKLWEDSPYLLKQLPGIGMVTAKALQSMGVKSFETLSEADPRKIEMVTGRKFPFGNHIKESLLSLPPKVDMKVEEISCPNYGKSKLVMTLTRLSQSPQATKRHYADMVVATEEDNMIVFHEKIRVEEFTSPYSATILVTSPLQGKLTVKADLIFEEFIGIDIHEKVILMKDINSHIYHDHGMKKLSLPQPSNVYIVDPDNDHLPQSPTRKPQKSLKSKTEEASMPSFKLLDEDSDEGERVVENNDDDCKIITEITVFDHIREKAKSLPFLAATPSTEHPPSLETLSLIRKRTHNRQLVLNELLESSNNSSEESSEPDGGTSTRSNMLTGDTIFEHIRKKSKCFPRVDEIKSLTTKSSIPDFDFDFDLSAGAESNDQVHKGTLTILDLEAVKPKGKANNEEKSPGLAKRQSCSLATAGETDPFLGFKSVFSFL